MGGTVNGLSVSQPGYPHKGGGGGAADFVLEYLILIFVSITFLTYRRVAALTVTITFLPYRRVAALTVTSTLLACSKVAALTVTNTFLPHSP